MTDRCRGVEGSIERILVIFLKQMPWSSPSSPARRFVLFVVAVFAMASVVNIAWEIQLPSPSSGIRGHPDERLSTLARIEQPTIWRLSGFASVVHDIGRTGNVIVPAEGMLDQLQMENLSQVAVLVDEYSPELTADPAELFSGHARIGGTGIVASGGEVVPWLVVWDDDSEAVTSIRLFTYGPSVILVDERLVDEL